MPVFALMVEPQAAPANMPSALGSLSGTLPEHLSQAVWRGDALGQAQHVVMGSGHTALDAELPGGGWPCQSLVDILQPQPGLAEWRLLLPVLRELVAQGGSVLLISPPHTPCLTGLQHEGLPAERLVLIQARSVAERLWAAEQALKTPCLSAVLCWLPQARPEQLRRLHACAAQHPGLLFAFRPLAARADSSAAPLRLSLSLGAWPHPLMVDVFKRRGPALPSPLTLPHWPAGLMSLMPRQHPPVHAPPTQPVRAPDQAPRTANSPPSLTAPPWPRHHAALDSTDPRTSASHSAGRAASGLVVPAVHAARGLA
jgi:protein ImuA